MRVARSIANAASQGDLSENAEYEQALAKRDIYQNKVVSMEKRIAEVASLDINRLPKDKVAYGSRVTLLDLDSDKEVTYKLVLPEELNEHPDLRRFSPSCGTNCQRTSVALPFLSMNLKVWMPQKLLLA